MRNRWIGPRMCVEQESHQFQTRNMKSLTILLRQSQSHFPDYTSPSRSPGLLEKAGDNLNLCLIYVELRTPISRRKVAEKLIMRTLPTLTRLVLVAHGNDYEFRRNLFTGVITGEILITRNSDRAHAGMSFDNFLYSRRVRRAIVASMSQADCIVIEGSSVHDEQIINYHSCT